MGISVSTNAHIYETKVFRPYPAILYRLRLVLYPLVEKKWCPSERQNLAYSVLRQLY